MPSEVVSNTQLRTFKRCRRKYWLTYVRKLKPRFFAKTGARQLGTRVHGALDVYYPSPNYTQTDESPLAIALEYGGLEASVAWLEALRDQEIAAAEDNLSVVEEINKEHDLAMAMVEGYDQWVQETGADSDLIVISKEEALRTESPVPGVELIGKLDVKAYRESTGTVGFIDYKTVPDLQTPLKTLGTDEQMRMYALMQRLLDKDQPVRWQIYRMLKKVKRTGSAKPPFFRDYEVYINDEELRGFWERLYGEIHQMLRFEHAIESAPQNHRSLAYPTPTRDCSWDCDFYGVCPLFDDSRSDPEHVVAMNFEVGDPHEHYGNQLALDS